MPIIARFNGIVIRIQGREHNPPHVHAEYQGQQIAVSLQPIRVMQGTLPQKQTRQVLDWIFENLDFCLSEWGKYNPNL